jgi:hypothetical protein
MKDTTIRDRNKSALVFLIGAAVPGALWLLVISRFFGGRHTPRWEGTLAIFFSVGIGALAQRAFERRQAAKRTYGWEN